MKSKSESRDYLRRFAASAEISYGRLLVLAIDYIVTRRCVRCPTWKGIRMNDEFWDHFEVVSGDSVAAEERGTFLCG